MVEEEWEVDIVRVGTLWDGVLDEGCEVVSFGGGVW